VSASLPELLPQEPGVHVELTVGDAVRLTIANAEGRVILAADVAPDALDDVLVADLRRFYRRQRPQLTLVASRAKERVHDTKRARGK
jgi:hypothetical protein